MSWIQMTDAGAGLEVNFYDYQHSVGDFVETTIASGLTRTDAHNIKLQMDFVDGSANDIVKVWVDGSLVHTGTSWEDFYRDVELTNTRTVDSLLFRVAGDAAPDIDGYGFLFDNIQLTSSLTPCQIGVSGSNPTVYTLQADCITDHTVLVPQNAGGSVFNGNGHSITGVDPTTGRFLGGVVQAQAGSSAITVKNLTVTVSNLADGCDNAANDRLRGILFDGVGGVITNNHVTDIEQGTNGESGCQEGNGIEARNAPFTGGGTYKVVSITGNQVTDYQKTGIIANGSVTATIKNNDVTGDGAISYIAQNGIQLGYGAKGTVTGNTVSGNAYSGAGETSSAGVLVVGGPCFPTNLAYTVGLTINKNTLTQNDVGVWLFNANAACAAPALKTNNTVKFNTISNTVVTNTTGNGGHCGYQAGISDVGHKDLIVNNMISGAGYTRVPSDCPFLRLIDLDSSTRGAPSNK
jgi:hypothetical protein